MAASQHSQPAVLSNFFNSSCAPVLALGNLSDKSVFFVCVLLAALACNSSWGDDGSPLFVMGRDGKGLRKLAEVPGRPFLGSPRWSKDGKWITFDAWSADGSQIVFASRPGQ